MSLVYIKSYRITFQYSAQSKWSLPSTLLEFIFYLALMNRNRSSFEFLPEHRENSLSKRNINMLHQEHASQSLSHNFIGKYCFFMSNSLKELQAKAEKITTALLKKNWIIFSKTLTSTDSIQIVWAFCND